MIAYVDDAGDEGTEGAGSNGGFVLMPTNLWGGPFISEYPWIRDLPRT